MNTLFYVFTISVLNCVGGRENLVGVLSVVPPPLAYAGWLGESVDGEDLVDLRYVSASVACFPTKTKRLRIEVREQKLGSKGVVSLCRSIGMTEANETNFRSQLGGLSNSGGALVLAQAIEQYKRCAIEFDNLDADAFINALRRMNKKTNQMTHLEELSLRCTALDYDAASALSKLIAKHMPRLKRLYLSGNPDIGDQGIEVLASAISKLFDLELLSISDCGLGDQACLALAKALRHIKRQEVFDLDLSRNPRLTAHGVAAILSCCPKLRRLDVRCCALFEADAPEYERLGAFCRSIKPHLFTLEHLPLTDVGLDPWSAALLTKCVLTPRSTALKSLELSINPLTPYELAYRRTLPGNSMASRFKAKLFKRAKPKKNIDAAILGGEYKNTHVATVTTDALVVLATLLASGAAPNLELLRLMETGVTAAHSRRFQKALRKRQLRLSSTTVLPQLDLRFNRDIHKEPDALESPAVAMVASGRQDDANEDEDDY